MTNSAGSFERAFEELIRRVVREELSPARATEKTEPARAAGPGLEAVSRAVSDIARHAGKSEILAAALRGALAVAGRCALFVRRGDAFSVWQTEGYSSQTAAALRSVAVSATQQGIFKELGDTRQAVCRQRVGGALPQELERALGSAAGQHVCLLPVVVQGNVVAALYSDAAGSPDSEKMSALEILACVAGLSLERVSTRETAPAGASAAAETHPEPVRMGTAAAEPSVAAVEEEAPSRDSGADAAVAVEVSAGLAALPDVGSLPENDRESHRKAHRFARVAVQDLLSYHKEKIADGRKNKNLFAVLKDDIQKTRENYQKRFGQTAASSFDYLHYEMVAKLAGNDPSVLGDQYPGPWSG